METVPLPHPYTRAGGGEGAPQVAEGVPAWGAQGRLAGKSTERKAPRIEPVETGCVDAGGPKGDRAGTHAESPTRGASS